MVLQIAANSIDDVNAIMGYGRASAWEQLASIARTALQDIDHGRWFVGDIANLIETSYGADSRGEFAKEIGVAKKTVYSWARVSATFPEISPAGENWNRCNLPENVSWSFCRELAKYDHADAWRLLEDASVQGYTVDQLARSIRPTTDKPKPFVCEAVLDEIIFEHIVLFVGCPLDGLQVGKRYRVRMEEIEDETI
jgi:hypothetical protein